MFRKVVSGRGRLFIGAGVLSVFAAFLSFAVNPHGETEQGKNADQWSVKLGMSSPAAAIFTRSCADCHSTATRWPWYSHVPPASWLIKSDVEGAQKHFNASAWSSYSVEKKRELLGDIARVVTNREMPLRQYLLVHRNARLSDNDGASLIEWARNQRRLLRKPEATESGVDTLPGVAIQ